MENDTKDKYSRYAYSEEHPEVNETDWEAYYTEWGKSMPFEAPPEDSMQRRRARMRFAAAFDNLPDQVNAALDVGGGDGYFGQLLLDKRPGVKAICFDLSRSSYLPFNCVEDGTFTSSTLPSMYSGGLMPKR